MLTFDLKDKRALEKDEIKISVKNHDSVGPDRSIFTTQANVAADDVLFHFSIYVFTRF